MIIFQAQIIMNLNPFKLDIDELIDEFTQVFLLFSPAMPDIYIVLNLVMSCLPWFKQFSLLTNLMCHT